MLLKVSLKAKFFKEIIANGYKSLLLHQIRELFVLYGSVTLF